ncbi:MAG TPA: DoxX family protein [Woeseiaceae bacterium]|nr:DoxX family protein [Woeseiaceae bacterium]
MVKAGWIMTGLVALFLLGASVAPKLMGAAVAIDSLVALGWPTRYLFLIGIIELACVLLFIIPRTSLLGAVLMTGLLGGAMASHLRADSPLFSHTLFSIYLGLFMWTALLLRDADLRAYLSRSTVAGVQRALPESTLRM